QAGGGDMDSNPRLRLAVDKAKGANMPNDTIDRAVKRGAGGAEGEEYTELRYEGYGPGGTAVIVDCLTDNHNRTASDVRHAFTKHGGNLGTSGSVAYMFNKQGVISYAPGCDEDAVMESALEAGADDVVTNDDGSVDVITEPDMFSDVKDSMVAGGLEPDNAEVTFSPSTNAELDQDDAEKLMRMVDTLEDLDDVQEVYNNAEISDEIMEALD
ncbi:MAG: YebC/PmpR family DNA-binding transcriptional regulator, partial [Gammaproteobacteria bacterium]|nr:YebC/PmpR family DNA-binding transcriptional regulator [Gammaproteobacteria bacterium]NNJ91570.1 YebC/PmpR family DNA-binding transcriptional regulator [Gammaproteobacteria bacterium]